MRAVGLMVSVALGLSLAAPPAAEAQPPAGKVYRIGVLSAAPSAQIEAFKLGLRELGYVEGQNLSIEYRYSEGRIDRLPALAAELVQLKVDAIFAPATASTRAARQATGTIPIIFAGVADPVGAGFATSLARPGGNITGLSGMNVELTPKRLELLKETVPTMSRFAVLFNPDDPVARPMLTATEVGARALGITLQLAEARGPADLDGAFASMAREGAGGLILLTGGLTFQRVRIAELATRNRLPAIGDSRPHAEVGLLMSYGTSYDDLGRRAATYVAKILKGAKPADLPVEQPTRFELVINLKTARALGLTIPPSLLIRADEIIQ